jgi:hypothetical protein
MLFGDEPVKVCTVVLFYVLYWSGLAPHHFFSLVMNEEDLTSRLFWNQLQSLCHRKLYDMSRHFLNNQIYWQKCDPTERWCLAIAVPEGT